MHSDLIAKLEAPEGQQEPMPRNVIWFGFDENTGEFTGEYCSVKPADARGMRPYIPYTARTPERVVTDEMVEAALEKFGQMFASSMQYPSETDTVGSIRRHIMRAALKAAMEAGR